MNVVVNGNHELVGIPNAAPNGIVWQVKCKTCDVELHSMQELEDHLKSNNKQVDAYHRAMKSVG